MLTLRNAAIGVFMATIASQALAQGTAVLTVDFSNGSGGIGISAIPVPNKKVCLNLGIGSVSHEPSSFNANRRATLSCIFGENIENFICRPTSNGGVCSPKPVIN